MAAVAYIRLFLGQEELRDRRLVDRVAIRADHTGCGVGTPADLSPRKVLCMTVEASVQNLLRLSLGESEDRGFAAARLYVSLPRTVATLASCFRRRLVSARNQFVVGVFVEVKPDVRMAGFADRAAYKDGGGRFLTHSWRGPEQQSDRNGSS